ncbi:hypothetical protein ACTXT7_006290 [Hymenolepis weldensis]
MNRSCWQIGSGVGLSNENKLNIPTMFDEIERSSKEPSSRYSISDQLDCTVSTPQICSLGAPVKSTTTIPQSTFSCTSTFSTSHQRPSKFTPHENSMTSENSPLINTSSTPLHAFRQFQPSDISKNSAQSSKSSRRPPASALFFFPAARTAFAVELCSFMQMDAKLLGLEMYPYNRNDLPRYRYDTTIFPK